MIGTLHLAQIATNMGSNPMFCSCCCDVDTPLVEQPEKNGGKQFQGATVDRESYVNPFMKLRPAPAVPESVKTYDTISDVDHGQAAPISVAGIPGKVIYKAMQASDRAKRRPGTSRYPVLPRSLKSAFEKQLRHEEEEFLILLIAEDEDCYE